MKLCNVLAVLALIIVCPKQSFSQTFEFDNPIAEKRTDPWVYKTEEGEYY